jgi:hypothetical protein
MEIDRSILMSDQVEIVDDGNNIENFQFQRMADILTQRIDTKLDAFIRAIELPIEHAVTNPSQDRGQGARHKIFCA